NFSRRLSREKGCPDGCASPAVALFELRGKLGLWQKAPTAEPNLIDAPVAPTNAPNILAVAGRPRREAEAAAIRTGCGNFGRIGERVLQRRDSNHYLPAHRHKIDRTPQRPPPACPVVHLAGWCATLRKACQDVDRSVQPPIGRSVQRIGDER